MADVLGVEHRRHSPGEDTTVEQRASRPQPDTADEQPEPDDDEQDRDQRPPDGHAVIVAQRSPELVEQSRRRSAVWDVLTNGTAIDIDVSVG